MRILKTLTLGLLLALALSAWCAEIHDAALKGDLSLVKELLAKDPSLINAKGHNEKAPLHWAAQGGHIAVAKYLLAKGAAVNELNIQKETPLVYAAEGGHLQSTTPCGRERATWSSCC
jgi:ankyrin repeat protein